MYNVLVTIYDFILLQQVWPVCKSTTFLTPVKVARVACSAKFCLYITAVQVIHNIVSSFNLHLPTDAKGKVTCREPSKGAEFFNSRVLQELSSNNTRREPSKCAEFFNSRVLVPDSGSKRQLVWYDCQC